MKKKAKPWCSGFVHMEGVPWSQSVWDSSSQRKLLRLLAEEEVGVQRLEAGRALVFPGEEGRCRGSQRREPSLRKEHGRKRLRN